MAEELFDVAVIGGGPSGAAAAIFLAKRKRSVVLIDREKQPVCHGAVAWLSARATPLLTELGVKSKSLLDQSFTDVTFHSVDFSKQTQPHFDSPPGYLVDRTAFSQALLDGAKHAGVEVRCQTDATDLKLHESSVDITVADDKSIKANSLILASGSCPALLDRLGIHRKGCGSPFWCLHFDESLSAKDQSKSPRVAVVLGLDRNNSFAMFCTRGEQLSATLYWYGEHDEARSTFALVCQQAFAHGCVPVDFSTSAVKQTPTMRPGSAALDIESHVGKHALVVGDAGGFVSAVSNEGLYPAMWSAQIAATVLDEALTSNGSQDVLMEFDSRWRLSMADYLRSPNTDTQFLLPLVFSNQKMANRMGAAFFSGENI